MISFLLWGLVAVIFLALYFCAKLKNETAGNRISNWILLASSYIFIAYADFRYVIIIALLTLSTWACAKSKSTCKIGIFIALTTLAFFKYSNFFIDSLASLGHKDFLRLNVILPLGISFYTFSAIGYLIDVKREHITPRSLNSVALYLSFFPKLTSGPIQKSKDFFEQIEIPRKIGWNTFSSGIQIVVFGLFKKIVLADRLSVFVNQVYETPLAFGSFTVLLAVIAYSFQIYFDFSAYSDIAIGISNILGIKLPRNFNLPYLAHNETEFWKRWHITLSSWLQEYLYISLGGNRKGSFRTYVNLVITMLLGGIWHGANWTYMIWGLLHGAALVFHKLWMKFTGSKSRQHTALSKIVCTLSTFSFTSFCWIFFRADSLSQAMTIIRRLFSFESGLEQPYFWLFIAVAVFIAAASAAAIKSKRDGTTVRSDNSCSINGYYPIMDLSKFWNIVAFFVFCGLTACLAFTGGSPFIYGSF